MFAHPKRALLALCVLLTLAVPSRAEVGDEHLVLGNPNGGEPGADAPGSAHPTPAPSTGG